MNDKYADLKHRYLTSTKSFRECHHIVGEIVVAAEKEKMPLDEFVRVFISKKVTDEVFDLKKAMAKRNIIEGSTGIKQVKKQLKRWKKTLSERPNRPSLR